VGRRSIIWGHLPGAAATQERGEFSVKIAGRDCNAESEKSLDSMYLHIDSFDSDRDSMFTTSKTTILAGVQMC